MRALIDAHMLGGREGGNETYVAGLLTGFERIGDRVAFEVTALVRPGFKPPACAGGAVRYEALASESDLHRLLFGLRRVCSRSAADILHSTYISPPGLRCPLALSVHDVIFRSHPEYFSPRDRLLLSLLVPPSIRKAKVILTLSEASRRQITSYYPVAAEKIRVVALAPGPVATVQPDMDKAKGISAGRRFILAVGSLQPRKNLARLVEAYAACRAQGRTDAMLVIVGRSQWKSSAIARAVDSRGLSADVVFAGFLPQEVLSGLYRRCEVFVYPSLVEGFGLPILEAMACGAPVITSDRAPMSELGTGAAILVDPDSTASIADALARVMADRDLRSRLRELGRLRAAEYTWQRMAEQTLEAYSWALQ